MPGDAQLDTSGSGNETTRRTWEIELLISGAIVVALFKLPGAVDGVYQSVLPRISRDLHQVLWSIYWPTKMVITPALLVFVCHILLRGFWVGLVGLNAVYPRGVDWERANVGPILRRMLEDRIDPIALEKKADQIASLLFAVLFAMIGILSVFGFWICLSQAIVLAGFAFGLLTGSISEAGLTSYFATLGLLSLPMMAAGMLDKLAEKKPGLAERSWYVNLVNKLFRFSGFLLMMPLWYSLMITLQSNLVQRKPDTLRSLLYGLGIGLLIPLFVLGPTIGSHVFDKLDSYIYRPTRAQESGMRSAFYRSLSPANVDNDLPSIQSDQIKDPFVRLYLPYDPWRDNNRLAELCPDLAPFRRDGDLKAVVRPEPTTPEARQEVLACFEKLWSIELNTVEIELDLLFADTPDGVGRGLVAYLATANLPIGRNDLILTRSTTEHEQQRRRYDPDKHRFFIPFWKS